MTRSIEQIKQDLAAIEEKTKVLAGELRKIYGTYLELLARSAQKQLILATYQICTQIYPESFLKLSFSQRQKLQATLRQLSKTILSEIKESLEQPIVIQDISLAFNMMEQMLLSMPNPEIESPQPQESSTETPAKTIETINDPADLMSWTKQVEKEIRNKLEKLSKEANRTLQEAAILPSQLPAKVFEIAMQAEQEGGSISSAPNLLNLLVETNPNNNDESSESEPHQVTKLTAIHLRLSEIEFADPSLSQERKQIRSFLENLSKLRQQYRYKQQEKAIAEAEAAWRASWYEE